jgi:RNA polymerase sigma factor (sigma-70 family)
MLTRPMPEPFSPKTYADLHTPSGADSRRMITAEYGSCPNSDQPDGGATDPWRSDAAAAAAGDTAAFERLYRAQSSRVFSICMRMVSDRRNAEELTQDVFVRVWQKLPTYRGDSLVSTWLHRVAVNVVLTQHKAAGAQKNSASDDEGAIALAAARPERVGDRLDLEAAIARLPRGARQIFVLHDIEGFTHEEIGAQLGISAGGSKAQLHRARLLLRQALTR